jgi:D-alanyl-D-alanine carboxypeptidase
MNPTVVHDAGIEVGQARQGAKGRGDMGLVVGRREFTAGMIALLAAGPARADAGTLTASLATLIGNLVVERRTAGAAIGVRRGGSAPFVRTFGAANLETSTPVRADTIFRIASVTKQFTAAAIMQLIERGRLALEAPAATYLPEFPRHEGGGAVTIHQLLTHTSGLHDYVNGGMPADAGDWSRAPDRHRQVARMTPLYDFPPGSAWAYSNTNYLLLGAIIERLSGQSYGEYLHANLLGPAGMTDTALDHYADLVPRRASGYALEAGAAGAFRNAAQSGLPMAEGGLRSTIGDMMRWNSALFGGRIVAASSLAAMTAPARTAAGALVGTAHFVPPGGQANSPPPFVQQSDYGFGLEVSRMLDRRVIWHSGGIPGFNAIVMHWPDADLDIVLLANTDNGLVTAFEPLVRAIAAAL